MPNPRCELTDSWYNSTEQKFLDAAGNESLTAAQERVFYVKLVFYCVTNLYHCIDGAARYIANPNRR